MIVLSEASDSLPPSSSRRDLEAATEAARLVGMRVHFIEPDFERCGDAEGALAHLPEQLLPTPAIWIGYIPTVERYTAIYSAAASRRIHLLNTPEQYTLAMEFDRFYPLLADLTPESVVVTRTDELSQASDRLGFPIFVKGVVQSRKSRGLHACLAHTPDELDRLCRAYLALPARSRGRIVLRRFVPLRHVRSSPRGFPFGREYRVFLFAGRVLDLGYYWEGEDPLRELSAPERARVCALARTAWERLSVPYLAVDVGQLETGEWIVVETGDGQFCGVCEIPRLRLLHRLLEAHDHDGTPVNAGVPWAE